MLRLSLAGGRPRYAVLARAGLVPSTLLLTVLALASAALAAQTPTFTPALSAAGMDDVYGATGIYGPGVATVDFDQDGDLDIFVPNDMSGHKLYRNNGDGTFADCAPEIGLSFITELPPIGDRANVFETDPTAMMPSFVDTDNDGDLDFFLTCWNSYNRFFENVNGSFVDRTHTSGLAHVGRSATAAWADFDKDGDLDVYVADWGGFDHLFQNDGNNQFSDVSVQVGLYDINTEAMPGWNAIWFDHNRDGWLDLYVGNDYGLPNFFYLGDGTGGLEERGIDFFPELSEPRGPAGYGATMGSALGDFDHDGDYDLFVANSQVNDFYRNDAGQYVDMLEMPEMVGPNGPLNSLKNNDIGWFCEFPDVNNDGWEDLFLVNGYIRMCFYDDPTNPDCMGMGQPEQPNILWVNRGDGGFDRVTDAAGLTDLRWGKGAAFADFDRDGDLDLFVTNSAGMSNPGTHGFWTNDTVNANHWSIVTLEGTQSNRDGLGAEILVHADGVTHRRWRTSTPGYLSQAWTETHFGLGAATQIDWVEIHWPLGNVERVENLPVDRRLHFVEGQGVSVPALVAPAMSASLADGGVVLTWQVDPAMEFDRFRIFRAEAGGIGGTIASIDADPSRSAYRWVDERVQPGRSYRYVLTAERGALQVDGEPEVVRITELGRRVAVGPALPNPFNPRTELRYVVPAGSRDVRLRILDARGRSIREFEAVASGVWESVIWDGTDRAGMAVSSGSYRFVVEAEGRVESTALTLVR